MRPKAAIGDEGANSKWLPMAKPLGGGRKERLQNGCQGQPFGGRGSETFEEKEVTKAAIERSRKKRNQNGCRRQPFKETEVT